MYVLLSVRCHKTSSRHCLDIVQTPYRNLLATFPKPSRHFQTICRFKLGQGRFISFLNIGGGCSPLHKNPTSWAQLTRTCMIQSKLDCKFGPSAAITLLWILLCNEDYFTTLFISLHLCPYIFLSVVVSKTLPSNFYTKYVLVSIL